MDNPTIPGAIRRLTLLVESGGILSPAEVADVRLVCKAAAMNNELVEALRYAIKQVPELDTVPGIAAVLAKVEAR